MRLAEKRHGMRRGRCFATPQLMQGNSSVGYGAASAGDHSNANWYSSLEGNCAWSALRVGVVWWFAQEGKFALQLASREIIIHHTSVVKPSKRSGLRAEYGVLITEDALEESFRQARETYSKV